METKVVNLLVLLFFVLVMLTSAVTIKNYLYDSDLSRQIQSNKRSITELEKSLKTIEKEKQQTTSDETL